MESKYCSSQSLGGKAGATELTNRNQKWLANYEALKAYIAEHHHLPSKSATDGKWMLNFAKYVRKTIKEGKCEDWKREMFESLLSERHLDEHTGGRKPKRLQDE